MAKQNQKPRKSSAAPAAVPHVTNQSPATVADNAIWLLHDETDPRYAALYAVLWVNETAVPDIGCVTKLVGDFQNSRPRHIVERAASQLVADHLDELMDVLIDKLNILREVWGKASTKLQSVKAAAHEQAENDPKFDE